MASIPMETIDQARAEEFGARVIATLNGASTALLMSIGHQTGLFDVMAELPPSTSDQIAESAGLNERYVREWLGGMVTSGFVEYEPEGRLYQLPIEHALSLTRNAGPDNLAFFGQYITLLAEVEQEIVKCFRHGGGVPYSSFPRFQQLQAEETARVFDQALLTKIVPLVSGLEARLRKGIDVAEIGCGYGHALNLLANEFPRSTFTGFDFSQEAVSKGREKARELGLDNIRFENLDVAALDHHEAYDLITAFDAIHDQVAPRTVLANIRRALRPDGVFLMADMAASSRLEENRGHLFGPLLYTISCMHCMTVSLSAGGDGLGTVWGDEAAREHLATAGFTSVKTEQVEGDILNLYYIAKP